MSNSRLQDNEEARQHIVPFRTFINVNNISIGATNPLHALLSTFPDDVSAKILMIITSTMELFIFSSMSFTLNYKKIQNLEISEKNISISSSAFNSFVFTYSLCCEIISLSVGKKVKLTPPMIAAFSTALIGSVGIGGITLYRDIRESRDKAEGNAWRVFSKLLDVYLFIVAASNTINQMIRLIESIKNSESDQSDKIIFIVQIILISCSIITPLIGQLCGRHVSSNLTEKLGGFSNIIHDCILLAEATKLTSPSSYLIGSAVIMKPLMAIGIFGQKSCARKSEGEESLLDNEQNLDMNIRSV